MSSGFSEEYDHGLTMSLLAQISGSKSDPYTSFVLLQMCKGFKIPIRGQKNVSTALGNLPVYQAKDDQLTFGWDSETLLQGREFRDGAYEHLALAMALSETFHENYAARVLYEMAREKADPIDVTPHFSHWKDMTQLCNGSFATVDLGILVEDYLRMDPFNIIADSSVRMGRWPVEPKAMAQALIALSHVTSGKEKQVTLIGSALIAWFAAVAEWLYDLRFTIISSNGTQLHTSHPGQDTQVLFVFVDRPCIKVSSKGWEHDGAHVSDAVNINQSYSSSIHTTPFGGRIVWQSLLPKVFGRSFHYLDHQESRTLGMFIGSAARLFQSLALDETKELHTDLVSAQSRANSASYGPGLIQTLTNWLPELRRFQGRMERALKASPDEAGTQYAEHLTRLRTVCHCGICLPKEKLNASNDGVPPEHGYCLTVLAETIVSLGLLLSRITVTPALYPARAGIQSFYQSQAARRMEARGLHWSKHFALVYGTEWNAPDVKRLQNCVQIFSGSQPREYLPNNLVAVSHEGICAYFIDLDPSESSKSKDPVRLIRVVSGGINFRHKIFRRACFGPVEEEDFFDPWEELQSQYLSKPLYCR